MTCGAASRGAVSSTRTTAWIGQGLERSETLRAMLPQTELRIVKGEQIYLSTVPLHTTNVAPCSVKPQTTHVVVLQDTGHEAG